MHVDSDRVGVDTGRFAFLGPTNSGMNWQSSLDGRSRSGAGSHLSGLAPCSSVLDGGPKGLGLPRVSGPRLSIGVFGAFHPQTVNAATSTTGIAYLMSECPNVSSVIVFAPSGSTLPRTIDPHKVSIRACWEFRDPFSLLRALREMHRERNHLSGYVFNIYLTSFGVKRTSNLIGLCLPTILRIVSKRPVVVYLHNFLGSQDVTKLGYNPSRLTRLIVRGIERALARFTRLLLPLEGQARAFRKDVGGSCDSILIPFVDAVCLPESSPLGPASSGDIQPSNFRRIGILLFGAWGPQKDLFGVLQTLNNLDLDGEEFLVTVAGHPNQNHPSYSTVLETARSKISPDRLNIIDSPSSDDVPKIFDSSEVLILPYVSLEGFSGVMNLGAFYGLKILAYDIPELRDCASALGCDVEFVPVKDYTAIASSLRKYAQARHSSDSKRGQRPDHIRAAARAVTRLIASVEES
jgi:glycosyltransferase involved in cell wall biosynthesis